MENLEAKVQDQNLKKVITLMLMMVMIALAAYTYLTLEEAKHLGNTEASISVSGEGEVLARPDIATFSFSVVSEGDDAGTAQEKSAIAMNEILDYLKEKGVDEKDIKTQYYNLSPRYEYLRSICNKEGFCPPGERVLRGYEVNQTVSVKVREIDAAGALLSGVGTRKATNVSGLRFTIDDEDVFQGEAREKAIVDAKEKARVLADQLGVKIVSITSFFEEDGGRGGDIYYARAETLSFDGVEDSVVAPSIPTGENVFTSRVNIVYKIK